MRLNRRTLNAGLAASLAAPMLSRVARAAETLKIGMVIPVTGPAAAVGGYALAGAKIALDRVNKSGGVLGKQLELVTEDDQTTNPGAVLAFSKLAAQPDIIAFLGPVRSTQNHAIANDILKTAKPFCFGGTDPALTKMGNPWMIRFRPNDSYSGRVIASYGIETLGKKNWALVHSTDAFGTSGNNLLAAAIGKLGGKVAIDQGYPNQSQDFTPVVLAIKSSGADVIGSYFTYENDQAIFARQAKQLGLTIPWVGSATTVAAAALKLAGPALWGTYAVTDYAADSSPAAKEFAKLYAAVSSAPPDLQSAWPYDAIGGVVDRHQQSGVDGPSEGSRRDALGQGLPGSGGRVQLRPVRRWPSRIQHRAQREGDHRLRQAYRVHGLISASGGAPAGVCGPIPFKAR